MILVITPKRLTANALLKSTGDRFRKVADAGEEGRQSNALEKRTPELGENLGDSTRTTKGCTTYDKIKNIPNMYFAATVELRRTASRCHISAHVRF